MRLGEPEQPPTSFQNPPKHSYGAQGAPPPSAAPPAASIVRPIDDNWDGSNGSHGSSTNSASNPKPKSKRDRSRNKEGSDKKKRKRCGTCPGCELKDNCGECGPCKSVRSHQICKMRKCDQLKTKKDRVRDVSVAFFYYFLFILLHFRFELQALDRFEPIKADSFEHRILKENVFYFMFFPCWTYSKKC